MLAQNCAAAARQSTDRAVRQAAPAPQSHPRARARPTSTPAASTFVASFSSAWPAVPAGSSADQRRHDLLSRTQQAIGGAIASSTSSKYQRGVTLYKDMCKDTGLDAPLYDGFYPPTPSSLMMFATFLADTGVQDGTIKSHMSAVRRHAGELDLPDPYPQGKLPSMVAAAITGHQRKWALEHPFKVKKQAYPATVDMVHTLVETCDRFASPYDAALVRVIITLAQASGGRAGDFLPQSPGKFDARLHFTTDSVVVTDDTVTLTIRSSKTDKLYKGRQLVLRDTPGALSIVSALRTWLQFRQDTAKPDWLPALFVKANGTPYATQHFRGAMKFLVRSAGLPEDVAGHSFRRGGTSTLANSGFSDAILQRHGNWKSNVFKQYVDVSDDVAKQIASVLATRSVSSHVHVPTRRASIEDIASS